MRTDRIAHILSLDAFGRIVTDFLFMHALCRSILFFLERVPRDFQFSWINTNGYFGSFHMVSLDETVCRLHLELRWILSRYIIGSKETDSVYLWNGYRWKRIDECRTADDRIVTGFNVIYLLCHDLQIARTHSIWLWSVDDWLVTQLMEWHFHWQFFVVQRLLVEVGAWQKWLFARINKQINSPDWDECRWMNRESTFAYVPNNKCDDKNFSLILW